MRWAAGWLCLAVVLAAGSARSGEDLHLGSQERIWMLQHSPLPEARPDSSNAFAESPQAAELGRRLFFDARVSENGLLACASCHRPERGWTDGRSVAQGLGAGRRNTPSLWNVAQQRWFFWDGRADSLWSQALKPLESSAELGGDRMALAQLISRDPEYRRLYESVWGRFPDLSDPGRFPEHAKPTAPYERAWGAMSAADQMQVNSIFVRLGKAIAAFELRIAGAHSAVDVFVAGLREDDSTRMATLSDQAQHGFRLFIGKGQCRNCHSGPNFSDGAFHNLQLQDASAGLDRGRTEGIRQLAADPFHARGPYSDDPQGPLARLGPQEYPSVLPYQGASLAAALAESGDLGGRFRTPSLRNVALTAPYMHAGQFSSLREVVEHYTRLEASFDGGRYGRPVRFPVDLNTQEVEAIVEFLEALTDLELSDRLRSILAPAEGAARVESAALEP